ncbi:MAG: acyltransferase family protein [Mycobacteriaceae bacterium]|nr:acyltransferase family protein [Mycobacteriaceae bacterium]
MWSSLLSTDEWDPAFTRRLVNGVEPLLKRWFRPQVRGLDAVPSGAALIVSNHSGGMFTPDVLIFASAFYRESGYRRPLYTLGHDALFTGPLAAWSTRIGLIRADRSNAVAALRSGGIVLDFPGGVYDAYRPTFSENVVDFNGRTGYVSVAVDAGVPIVPMVSIGGQESQLFLTRGSWLAKQLGLKRFRSDILPITIGVPFGVSVLVPPNVPLPTKIVAQVLTPIDVAARFGDQPDIDEVDAHVRSAMQRALDGLASERRFPVLG